MMKDDQIACVEGQLGQFGSGETSFAIVASRFNRLVVDRLVDGALDVLRRHGVAPEAIKVVWVPGAWELPLAARQLARSGQSQAIVAVGAVIRGETPHFDYVASACSATLARVQVEMGVAIGFGLLTTETLEQALDRAGGKSGNKGADAALAALEMVCVLGQMQN